MKDALLSGLKGLAAVTLLALVGVTVLDVIGRYLFDAPLKGAFELTQVLLAVLVFLALPVVTRLGGHVEADLFTGVMSDRIKRFSAVFGAFVTAGMLAFFAWHIFHDGHEMIADGARTEALHFPMGPVAYLAAAGCFLSAIFAVIRGIRHD